MVKSPLPPVKIKTSQVIFFLEKFFRDQLDLRGFSRVVIGLSGGLDSAVVLALAARSLGPEKVTAIILPYKQLSGPDTRDARDWAKKLGIASLMLDISPQLDRYFKSLKEKKIDRLRLGNKIARERMSVLYDFSRKLEALVVGTSNRTELLLGYGTVYGDLACAFMPLGSLYKTQVYQLAQALELPFRILSKKPSARLWPGQTDEKELGITYENVDRLLYLMIDKKFPPAEIVARGFSEKMVEKIGRRVAAGMFKLCPPAATVLPAGMFIYN